jgi:hypothetical protein
LNPKFYIARETLSGNWLTTIAVGEPYFKTWTSTVSKSWLDYAEAHDLGIIVVVKDLIDKSDVNWKKPNWQKLLIPSALLKLDLNIEIICYLDTDILINPFSPNVFDLYEQKKIGVVSLRKNLPFHYDSTLRKLALLRRTYLDNSYPLDSALFISLSDLYKFHELPVQEDEFCSGFFLFNLNEFASIMESWFFENKSDVKSITNDGDQTHINYYVQSLGLANYLPYEYQAIWSFEAANYYSFLFAQEFNDVDLYKLCIQSTLLRVNFLHFAGSWTESSKFSETDFEINSEFYELFRNYQSYSKETLSGKPRGLIRPKKSAPTYPTI